MLTYFPRGIGDFAESLLAESHRRVTTVNFSSRLDATWHPKVCRSRERKTARVCGPSAILRRRKLAKLLCYFFEFFRDGDLHRSYHVAVQLDIDREFPKGLQRFIELDLAAIQVEAAGFEFVRDV